MLPSGRVVSTGVISNEITTSPFIRTLTNNGLYLISISIGLYHLPMKCDFLLCPTFNVIKLLSTYNPSFPTIGPNIFFSSVFLGFILSQNSAVSSLYLPLLCKNPFPGTARDGRPADGLSYISVIFPEPNTIGNFVFLQSIRLLYVK